MSCPSGDDYTSKADDWLSEQKSTLNPRASRNVDGSSLAAKNEFNRWAEADFGRTMYIYVIKRKAGTSLSK